MGALLANSREENSPQEQQQRSNTNHTPRLNLNVLLPQPRLPINSDDSDSEYESDEYFGDEDFEDNEQEEVKKEIKLLQLRLFLNRELTNMMMRSFNLKSLKLVKRSKTCKGEWVKPLTNNNLWSMMGDLEDDLEEHIDVLL
ncbi:Telomere-binding protein subunit beta [Gossypium australe]|uniref:Telomere-binding protein subunit beta n=1 Tax=Gossypium australe TaxID=47621 RepID=A0A5B6W777_9ROSI|nr:Telomere-binding protein subunit beta [Gossypium australe]